MSASQTYMKPATCKSCDWGESELRRRVLGNGSVQLVYQCLNCGRSTSNPLSHTLISAAHKLPAWDEGLAKRYDERRDDQRQIERQEWFEQHNAYLRTPKWRDKRRLVLERCAGLCEGCRSAPVEHVHHLSYDHWQDELLWELVGVCENCHHRAHKVVKFVGVNNP
jgi:hypothetical protein